MSRDPRRALDRARDILDAIANIQNDLGALSKDAFLEDGKTQRAVIEGLLLSERPLIVCVTCGLTLKLLIPIFGRICVMPMT